MTTIAIRDGIVAADSGLTNGNTIIVGATKIVKRPSDGAIITSSGSAAYAAAFREWALAGGTGKLPKRPDEPSRGVIVLKGAIWLYETDKGPAYELRPPYYALGSGQDFAIGAMWMGATAEQAVAVAIEHDVYTIGPILVLREGRDDDAA